MPRLVMVGLSHHTTALELRERVALGLDTSEWQRSAPGGLATLVLSTCNRLEVYAWVTGRTAAAVRLLCRGLAGATGLDLAELQPHLNILTGQEALLHVVRVTSGLDSLVVGEEQIRGQVREAVSEAVANGPSSSVLKGVFERAGESARRIRGGTSLGKAPSIATAGVNVACRGLGQDLDGKLAVVLGAGVMARAAVESLITRGARVQVLNRTPANAQRLVAHLGGSVQVGSLDALPAALRQATLVVGATASRTPVLDRASLEQAMQARGGQRLVLLDIALPRDIDSAVRGLPGVSLIDLDDLERECPVDVDTRRAEQHRAEALAVQEADRLAEWLRLRAVSPAIAELRTYAETIRTTELRRSAARLRDLTPEQTAAVEALTAGIVNKLMHGPTVALRAAAARPGGPGRSRTRILRMLRPPRGRTA